MEVPATGVNPAGVMASSSAAVSIFAVAGRGISTWNGAVDGLDPPEVLVELESKGLPYARNAGPVSKPNLSKFLRLSATDTIPLLTRPPIGTHRALLYMGKRQLEKYGLVENCRTILLQASLVMAIQQTFSWYAGSPVHLLCPCRK